MRRRQLMGAMAALLGCSPRRAAPVSAPVPPRPPAEHRADARQLADHLEQDACEWPDRAVDWARTRAEGEADVAGAPDEDAFVAAVERFCDQLCAPQLRVRAPGRPARRRMPADVWLQRAGDAIEIEAVRAGSAAARAGLAAGMRVTGFGDAAIDARIQRYVPDHVTRDDPRVDRFARMAAIAGREGRPRRFDVVDGGTTRTIEVAGDDGAPTPEVSARVEGEIGLLRLPRLDDDSIEPFDAALTELRDTVGILVDLRGCIATSPGATEAILGRFVTGRSRYASKAARDGERLETPWPVYVGPRGPWPYEGTVVAVVDRFTAGAAEDLAAGLQGLGRASVVGPPTAGWSAHLRTVVLSNTRVAIDLPVQALLGVDGLARERWVPDVSLARGDDLDAKARQILDRDIRRAD